MLRVLILGTGTGVGKTHVTSALALALHSAGVSEVRARKPIETGIQPSRHDGARVRGGARPGSAARPARHAGPLSDAQTLDSSSTTPCALPHPLYALREPVSPHLASRLEGVRISIPRVKAWVDRDCPDMTPHAMSCQLIETAGGLFSPITGAATNLDLALALEPALWVLVAHDGLGVLHDVRATLLALSTVTDRRPDFLVLSAARQPDASTGGNARELGRVALPRPVAVVSRSGDAVTELAPLARALLRRLR